ncbi:putative reductase [Janibacter sp. HTCC2649]|uniref:NADPH-dependent F420 reductase n=1 Tax=Janibacter sp. HTCC2649 TaxID=313589 RepID=UPI0000671897|nr:NAD(P)-binding domain-containing protein [Janibacter sp. HTCC2649]EAP97892.1 putative reductase [Janibacter sp. HTCC2649]
MTSISIIGSGNMATAIGTRAVEEGHTVEFLSREAAKAQALADQIGQGTTVGTYGSRPAGDIVILAVLAGAAVDVVTHFGEALSGKILVDITNPFNADGSGLDTTAGNSVAEQIAAAAPDSAEVVKAFNTLFSSVLKQGNVDGFLAGDSVDAKAQVAAFMESLNLRPRDAGALSMAHALEWAGLLLVGVARNGAGFDLALATQVA